jgi:hypothetical protein
VPGLATERVFQRRREFQVTGRRPLGTLRVAALSAGPMAPRAAFRFPPLSSPGRPSAAPRPLGAVWLGCPGRRTHRGASTITVSATRGCLPLLIVVGLAIGQSSTEPIRQRLESSSRRYGRVPPVRCVAGAASFVGSDSHYEPPASEA